ncbi:Zinc finger protein 425 [Frankliniella fusca]|uniref:Zinc finger protein 425 n=1 Tax=Frankliniella fusca TaxID=407009 RepID=A0AAE1L6T4_9NEOP|nr:Zinc finger protein 425 [Frankliniella fusca]
MEMACSTKLNHQPKQPPWKIIVVVICGNFPNSNTALCQSPCVGHQEWNNSSLTSSQQHLLQCQTPETVNQLGEEWAVAAPKDFQKSPETPWRIDLESPAQGIEISAEKTSPFETIDANRNVDTLCLINRLDSPPSCCNSHQNNPDDQESVLSFLSPQKITGELVLINKADSESGSIDIESIQDAEDCSKTDMAKVKELCAGRISRNKDGLWKCNICSGKYISLKKLKNHITRHYSGYPNQCVECEAFFETSDALDLHQIHHITSCLVLGHICPHCYKSFRLKHLLSKHLASDHISSKDLKSESKKFRETCGKCARVFYSSFEMENHDESCEDLVFDSDDESSEESVLPTRKEESVTNDSILCHVCKLSFDKILQLQLHLKMFHKNDDQLKCNVPGCKSTFKTSKAFRNHKRYHVCKFACNTCDKRYATSDKLKDHLRSHSGEKPFKCSLCDKSFSTSARLKSHENYHFKTFKCEYCGLLLLGSITNLRRHINEVHTRLKKVMCETCGDVFSRREHLHMHCFYHHEQYNFCCVECKRVFQTKESYEKHKLSHI